jgi:prolyl oligopeptidase
MQHPTTLAVALLALAACGPGALEMPPTPPTTTPPPTAAPVATAVPAAPALAYPATRREDTKDVLHGVTVEDPYRWLEDGKSPEVRAWMTAEDDLARAELKKLPERDAIAARLKELFYVDSLGAPRHRGERYFFTRRLAVKEKAVVYWKKGKDGDERVLFDPNTWSTDGSVGLGGWEVTHDGKLVAYQVHKNNSDEATLHVMDVATGKVSDVDVIEGAKYAHASWTPRGDGFYYTWLTTDPAVKDADRPGFAEIRFHKLGDDPKKDRTVRERTGDSSTFLSGYVSRDGHWLIVTVQHGWTAEDVYFADARNPAKIELHPLVVGKKAHYSVEVYKDRFYVTTDEGAARSRVLVADPRKPERDAWKEIVPERADAILEGAGVLGGKLALSYLKNVTSRLEIHDLDGKLVREVPLPGLGSMGGPVGREDEDEAYFSYESFTQPNEIRSLSIKTGETHLYSAVKVPVDPAPYTVEQVFYPSKDGTRVSMFIVRRKDLQKDGHARALLWGYGGFQVSETSHFAASIYPWLERGGIYAVPNLRGGSEYGEEWHKHGMLLEKQNVFDDLAGAASYLIQEGYTKPDRLAVYGGSNGGLLTGAAITQHPELFSAVVCAVPLLDMVRYHKSGSGATWTEEYGSAENPQQFEAILGYSPYHHVKPGTKYPPLLLLSADSDDRVDPMHARKFAGAMQAASTGGPVLLRIEKNSGHGGADLLKAEVQKGADRYAFLLAYTAHD